MKNAHRISWHTPINSVSSCFFAGFSGYTDGCRTILSSTELQYYIARQYTKHMPKHKAGPGTGFYDPNRPPNENSSQSPTPSQAFRSDIIELSLASAPDFSYLCQSERSAKQNTTYDYDSGRTFQETRGPLQGVRLHLPVKRDLRRSGRRLRLRSERRRVEEQHQALLVGFDGQAPRKHRGHRRRDLHAPPHMGGFGTRFGLQRSADRQQGFEETLPRRRTHRGVDRQTGREDRKGGRKGPQALRRVVRRGEIPRHVAPRRRDGRQTRRGTRPFRRGDERQRPGRTAADHPRLRDRLPHFGHAQLDGGTAVQPDVLHPDGIDGRRGQHDLPASRNGAGHLRQLPQRPENGPHETSVRHRADRQGLPQ